MMKKFFTCAAVIVFVASNGADIQAMSFFRNPFTNKYAQFNDNELRQLSTQFQQQLESDSFLDQNGRKNIENELKKMNKELTKRETAQKKRQSSKLEQDGTAANNTDQQSGPQQPIGANNVGGQQQPNSTNDGVQGQQPQVHNSGSNQSGNNQGNNQSLPHSNQSQSTTTNNAPSTSLLSKPVLIGGGLVVGASVFAATVFGLYHWLVAFEPAKNKAALDTIADSIEKIKKGINSDATNAGKKALKKLSIVSADMRESLQKAFDTLNAQVALKNGGEKDAYDSCKKLVSLARNQIDNAPSIKPLQPGFSAMIRHRVSYVWAFIKNYFSASKKAA